MNAPLMLSTVTVRDADLADANEFARIAAFVTAHIDGTPFHLPEWVVAVARGCDQVAHYLIAERADGELAGVLPLTEVHSPLFGRALVSSGFAVGGGVLASDPGAVAPLVDAAWALAERLSCPTLELRGGALPQGDGWHRDQTSYLGFARDLAADDDTELLEIPRKQRAEVRRSLGFELTVETGSGPHQRDDNYAVYAESVRNLGTPVFPKRLFAEVLNAFGDCADILTVRREGRAIASVLSLYWRGTVYPYWGGGTAQARALRANDRMYYALMCDARGRGCTRFDFGRSKVGTGAAAFKRNWGFTGEPLAYAKRAADGEQPREINPLSPKYRLKVAAWQKLPLGLANRIGPWIAKGLG
ncbi:FemAB family XrtA/PEP-CTERM system-associated protein [Sphingomonas sp. AX6]|uniref:FemAB family XrtA/PEP-CTERM system-associated protein n=1 Tax=Sphingomonas sp. AX6 TaxID=2653171 RepID=UPI0012F37C16|nr:FemAB family XrtA/PEP-CTERM system-associated protein [Sphingomonas sp. AX6]VXC92082.1 FemAB [Sphingomonas sp. AX6]